MKSVWIVRLSMGFVRDVRMGMGLMGAGSVYSVPMDARHVLMLRASIGWDVTIVFRAMSKTILAYAKSVGLKIVPFAPM